MASNKPLKLLTAALQRILAKIRARKGQQVERNEDRGGPPALLRRAWNSQ